MNKAWKRKKNLTAPQKASRITAASFVLVAVLLIIAATQRTRKEQRTIQSSLLLNAFKGGRVRPAAKDGTSKEEGNKEGETNVMTEEDDTEMSEMETLSVDFDGDSFQDRVSIVPGTDGNITIVFEKYTGALYTRIAEASAFINAKSATLSAMDMTGDHKMEVVCQGNPSSATDVNGGTSMLVYAYSAQGETRGTIRKIGTFQASSVFVDVADRTEAYNQSQAAGEPFHVWTYNHEGNSEIRTEWTYSEKEERYVVIGQTRVAISAAERAGGQATKMFLNGLWTRTESTDGDRFIYFDNKAQEIIFAYQDVEELYIWGDHRVRGGGAVITTTNVAIRTMKRRADITVLGTDEIRVRTQDAVRIVPNGISDWDGTYRRMNYPAASGGVSILTSPYPSYKI